MLTCCPQCGTTFRVSPQQLKVHQGEVRCGRCSTVFDAFDSLLAEPSEIASDQSAVVDELASSAGTVARSAASQPEPHVDEGESDAQQERRRELREMLPQGAGENATAGAKAANGAFGEKRAAGSRSLWIVLSLLALTALLLQCAFRFRAELGASWPESRPWLERACAELRCVVPLPRRVELVSIDASDLQVDTAHSNLMLLTATLKNRAPFAQEHPTLALTLTDTQDQPLARRVLSPPDYLDRKIDGKAGLAANGELAVKVYIDSREVKATGYRLFLFYP